MHTVLKWYLVLKSWYADLWFMSNVLRDSDDVQYIQYFIASCDHYYL